MTLSSQTAAVLKAAAMGTQPERRLLPTFRAAARIAEPAASERPPVGAWMSESELSALRQSCVQQGREQAFAEARAQAEREARARFEQEWSVRLDKLAKEQADKWRGLATALAAQVHQLREGLEAELSEWTFAAATRLLGDAPAERLPQTVRQVLGEARLDQALTVRVHADDLAAIQAAQAESPQDWPEGVVFAGDATVGLGGCLVDAPYQTLDARLETQLALLRTQLDAAREARSAAA